MLQCPQCGKELKHRGALNGHLAFAHGVVTEKGKTINELREEVASLREQMDLLYSCFKPYPDKKAGEEIDSLITYDLVSGRMLVLHEADTSKRQPLIRVEDDTGKEEPTNTPGRLVEVKPTNTPGRLVKVKPTIEKGKLAQLD